MERKWSTWASAILLLVAFLSGCNRQEGCTDPYSLNYNPDATRDDGSCTYGPSTVSLALTHWVGDQPFSLDSIYSLPDGRRYKFSVARFHVSGLALNKAAGTAQSTKYLQVKAGTSSLPLDTFPAANYTGLQFNIGVDSALNHGDPTRLPDWHPLSLMNPTQDHWDWSGGYVFLKLEGRVDSTANMTGPLDKFFYFHIASDEMLSPVNLPHAFTLEPGTTHQLHLRIDWGAAFHGVDLRRQSTQTIDDPPLARMVIDNFIAGLQTE